MRREEGRRRRAQKPSSAERRTNRLTFLRYPAMSSRTSFCGWTRRRGFSSIASFFLQGQAALEFCSSRRPRRRTKNSTYRCIDVRRRVDIRRVLRQERDDRDELRVQPISPSATASSATASRRVVADSRSTRPCAQATTAPPRLRSHTGRPPAHAKSRCTPLHSCKLRPPQSPHQQLMQKQEDSEEEEEDVLFGCHISVRKRILGGRRGKSGGKDMTARRKPPS